MLLVEKDAKSGLSPCYMDGRGLKCLAHITQKYFYVHRLPYMLQTHRLDIPGGLHVSHFCHVSLGCRVSTSFIVVHFAHTNDARLLSTNVGTTRSFPFVSDSNSVTFGMD